MTTPMSADYYKANKISTSNYLGIAYAQYENELYRYALATPEKYFDTRQKVFTYLTEKFAEEIYNRFYCLMTDGEDTAGDPLIRNAAGKQLRPNMEMDEINRFALSAARTMKEISEKCLEKLMPVNFDSIMKRQITKDGLAAAGAAT